MSDLSRKKSTLASRVPGATFKFISRSVFGVRAVAASEDNAPLDSARSVLSANSFSPAGTLIGKDSPPVLVDSSERTWRTSGEVPGSVTVLTDQLASPSNLVIDSSLEAIAGELSPGLEPVMK